MSDAENERTRQGRSVGQDWERVFNTIDDWVAVADLQSHIVFSNKTGEQIAGLQQAEIIGQSFCKLIFDSEEHVSDCPCQKVLRTGKRATAEFKIPRKETWLRVTAAPLIGEKGNLTGVVHIARDITEHKEAENALRQEKERYRCLFEHSPFAIILVSPDGKVVRANRTMEAITDYFEQELKKICLADLCINPQDWESLLKTIERSGCAIDFPVRLKHKNGNAFDALLNVSRIDLDGQDLLQIICIDVTKQKKAEEMIKDLAKFPSENPNPVLRVARDAKVLYCNDACLPVLAKWNCEIGGQVPETWRSSINKALESEKSIIQEEQVNGKIFSFVISPVPASGYANLYGRDVTEHKKVEEALRNEHNMLRTLLDNLPDAVYVKDSLGRFVACNIELARRRGAVSPEEMLGKTDFDLFPREVAEQYRADEEYVMQLGQPLVNQEVSVPERETGRLKWILSTKVPLRDQTGKVIGIVGIGRDITKRREAQEAVKRRLEFEKTIRGISARFVVAANIDESINVSLAEIAGLSGASRAYLFLIDEDTRTMSNANEWCAEGVSPQIGNLQNLPLDMFPWWMGKLRKGEIVHIKDVAQLPEEAAAEKKILESQDIRSLVVLPVHEGKRLTGFMGFDNVARTGEWKDEDVDILRVSSDIIGSALQRRKTQRMLLDYQKHLKSLASQLTLAEERERRRIAGELHDHVGQSLAFSKIKLKALSMSAVPEPARQTLDEVCKLLEQAIQQTRGLTFDLSSPLLYELGLESAVADWLTEHIERKYEIATEFEDDGQPKPLGDNIRVLLFRSVRELLVNVAKHSQAGKAKVSISKVGREIRIVVEDNGVGFDPQEVALMAAKRGGFGLFSIRERLQELGGCLEICSSPGAGCTVIMTAPLKGAAGR